MIDGETLGVLVKASETPALLIGLYALHLNYLGSGEYVGEFDGTPLLLLILYDLLDRFSHRISLGDRLVKHVSLIGVLVSLYYLII